MKLITKALVTAAAVAMISTSAFAAGHQKAAGSGAMTDTMKHAEGMKHKDGTVHTEGMKHKDGMMKEAAGGKMMKQPAMQPAAGSGSMTPSSAGKATMAKPAAAPTAAPAAAMPKARGSN